MVILININNLIFCNLVGTAEYEEKIAGLMQDNRDKDNILKTQQKEFDKTVKKLNSEIFSLKEQHKEELARFNKELDKKNTEIVGKLKKFIMQDIDLDEYNITSDDFRTTSINIGKAIPSYIF